MPTKKEDKKELRHSEQTMPGLKNSALFVLGPGVVDGYVSRAAGQQKGPGHVMWLGPFISQLKIFFVFFCYA